MNASVLSRISGRTTSHSRRAGDWGRTCSWTGASGDETDALGPRRNAVAVSLVGIVTLLTVSATTTRYRQTQEGEVKYEQGQ